MRLAVLVCVTACGRLGFDASASGPSDIAPDVAIDWTAWSTPVHITSAASDQFDWEPAIHPDGKVLVFTRANGDVSSSDLFAISRSTIGGDFGMPTKLALSGGSDYGPAWDPDGAVLYFTSNRSGSAHLYTTTFDGTDFGTTASIISELSTVAAVSPTISQTGLEMFFSDDSITDNKIFRSARDAKTDPWGPGVLVDELDTSATDGWPTLSPDGLVMLFESGRENDAGEIWAATRPAIGEKFSNITKVGALDDGNASGDPELTADGTGIFFGADRPESNGLQDLYFATRL